jgi:hypothetical protein
VRSLKCFKEMHDRVVQGWSLGEIAKYVQDVKNELKEMTRDQLIDAIKHYRNTIPPGQIIGRRLPDKLRDAAVKQIAKGLDELAEFERLYKLQMERIEVDFKNEKNISKLFDGTHNEISEARKILHASAQLKMDLGLNHRTLGTLNVDAQLADDVALRYGNDAVAKVVKDPESRHKVLALAQRVLGLSGRVSGAVFESAAVSADDGVDEIDEPDDESGGES